MIGLEPVVTGLIANKLYDGLSAKAEENKREVVQRPQIVEDIGATYLQTLRSNLKRTLGENADVDLNAVYRELDDQYDDVHEQLVMASDEEIIYKALVDAILKTSVPESEVQPADRVGVEDAVENALNTGFREFIQSVEEAGLTEVVELELDVEILKRITQLSQSIDAGERIQQNAHFTIRENPESMTEADSAALIGAPESSGKFVKHPSLTDIEYETSRIVVGKKGAGKSRSLAHLLSVICEGIEVDYIVNLENSFTIADIEDLLETGISGIVILICDDVHRLEGPKNIHPFRRLVKRLQTEIEDEGRLISLCGVRSERITSLPHINRINDDPVWSQFEKTRLESLDAGTIEAILKGTLEPLGDNISQSTIESLTQAVLAIDPTPMYTITIAQQLDSGSLSMEKDIKEILPKSIKAAWKDEYQVLKEEAPMAVNLLWILKVFDQFRIPTIESWVIEVFQDVFDESFIECERAVSKLLQKHWIEDQEFEYSGSVQRGLITHHAQFEAVPKVPKPVIIKLIDHLYEWQPISLDLENEYKGQIHTQIIKYGRHHPDISLGELVKHADKAVELAPDHPFVQSSVAAFYSEIGRNNRALELVTDAADSNPEYPTLNYNCGNLLNKIGDCERAKEYLEKAVSAKPDNPIFLHSLGVALVGNGEVQEGLKRLKQARDNGWYIFGEIFFSIGDAHNIIGNYEPAVENVERAIKSFEKDKKWLNLANAYELLTIIHFNQKEYEECIEVAEKGYKLTERMLNGDLPIDPVHNNESLDPEQIQSKIVALQSKAVVQLH